MECRTLSGRCHSAIRSLLLLGLAATVPAGAQNLAVEAGEAGFDFVLSALAGEDAAAPWLLQHSADLAGWQDLVFFQAPAPGQSSALVSVDRAELPGTAVDAGFFRAIRLTDGEAEARRPWVDNRRLWWRSAPPRYRFRIAESSGGVSWEATITVNDGAIEEASFSNVYPPFFEPTAVTVDGLFQRIGSALDEGAETVRVTWDPVLGYPQQGFIDISLLLADEERSWTILSFEVITAAGG